MNDKIKDMIQQYEKEGDFTHAPVPDNLSATVMDKLGVVLPEQFIEYLCDFSHGGIGGIVVFGIGLNGALVFVDETLDYRQYGLPTHFVVIENCDEWVMCIDCDTGKIVSWDLSGDVQPEFDSFDDYLANRLEAAIENQ